MLDVTILPYPTPLQQALIVTICMGIATLLLHIVLRHRRLAEGQTLRRQAGVVETQQVQVAERRSESHTCADKSQEECSGHCSESGLRPHVNSWATELFPQSQLHLGLEPQPVPLQSLPAYSARSCQACNSPKVADCALKIGRYCPDDNTPAAATVTRSPSTSISAGCKSSGDGSQSLAASSSPSIVPVTPPSACPSKHTGGCGVTDVASTGASGATCGALPSDKSFRPDNTSSAYDTARALVCHPWAQPYTPIFTLGRIALKIPDRDPSDLEPLATWTRPYCEALEAEGIALVGVYVRQGCIHIVLDFLDLAVNSSRGDSSGNGAGTSGGQHPLRHGRHLLGAERGERLCSSGGSSRNNSRRRSGRAIGTPAPGEPDAGDGSGVTAAASILPNQSAGRVSAPGDLLPLAAPGRDRPIPQQQRLQVSRHNTPVRVRSAEVAASAVAGPARIASLVRVAAITAAATGGDRSRSDEDDDGGSQHEDNNGDDDEDDGSGTIAPRSRMHLLSARRLRQLRRGSASSLLSGAAAVPGGGLPAPLPPLPSSASHDSATGRGAVQSPQPAAAAASRLPATLTPENLVRLLGPDIGGGRQTVTVQLPSGDGNWNVQMRQAGGAAMMVPLPPPPRPAPDLTCISPPCVLAGAQGPVMMYAAGTDMHGVGEGATATTGNDTALTVHMRFRGAYQACRASLLGDQMPAEALSRVLPLDALRRAEVLCLQLATPPSLPGLMFVECQRGGLLGAAAPVLVAPNAGVWQEVATLQDAAVREGGAALTAVQHLVMDLGLWLDYLNNLQTIPGLQPPPSQRQQQQEQQQQEQQQQHSQVWLHPLPSRLPPAPLPAPAPLHSAMVQAPPQPELSPRRSTNHGSVDLTAVSGWAGAQPPSLSAAGGGAGIGLGQLFGRSLLRLLSDAELVDPQQQLQTSPQSQPSPQQQQQRQQQQRDGIRQLEEMLATVEQHQEEQEEQRKSQQRRAILGERQICPGGDAVPCSASVVVGTSSTVGDLVAAGTRGPQWEEAAAEKHAEEGLQLLAPNMGVAYSSSPGPSTDAKDPVAACADDVGQLEYMRAISDPQTRGAVVSAPILSRNGGRGRAASSVTEIEEHDSSSDSGDEGAVLAPVSITVPTYPLQPPPLPPLPRAIDALPSEMQEALELGPRSGLTEWPLIFSTSAAQGQGGDSSSSSTNHTNNKTDISTASSGVAAATTSPKPAVAVSVATASAGCSTCMSACGLSLAAMPQPPHAQSLYNGRWQLPSTSPTGRVVKAAGSPQLDQDSCEGDGHMPPGPPPAQTAGSGDSEVGDAADACGLSPAVSINMLVLGAAEAATLSQALMSYGATTRTGASGNLHMPPVRTESSGTELRSWDSLTEVAQAVSATLPQPSGALATTPRLCSTFIVSPSPSRRPSLHLYGDGSRLRPSGAGGTISGSCWSAVIAPAANATAVASTTSSLDSLTEGSHSSEDRESPPFLRCNPEPLIAEVVRDVAAAAAAAAGSESTTLHHVAQGAEVGDAPCDRTHRISRMMAVCAEPSVSTETALLDNRACEGTPPAQTSRPAEAEPEPEIKPALSSRVTAPGAAEIMECAAAGTVEAAAATASGAAGTIVGVTASLGISSSVVSTAPVGRAAGQGALTGAAVAVPVAAVSEPVGPISAPNAALSASTSVVEVPDASFPSFTAGPARSNGHWPSFNALTIGAAPDSTALLHARMRHLGLGLLAFSVRRGWLHTTSELLRGLACVGVDLAEANASVAAREGGMSLLHVAVTARQPALLRMLLAAATAPTAMGSGGGEWGGAGRGEGFAWDVGARGPMGLTPLHLATALDDGGEVAALLLEAFPEAPALWFTASDDSGGTPAEMASQGQLHGLTRWAGRRLAEGAAWRWQHQPQQQQQDLTDRPTQLETQQQQQDVVRDIQQRQEGGLQQTVGIFSMQPHLQSDAFRFVGYAPSGSDPTVTASSDRFRDDAGGPVATAASASAAATTAASSTAPSGLVADSARWNTSPKKTAWPGRWLAWTLSSRLQQPPHRRESCLCASLTGFADSQMEERYRAYRVNSFGVIDTTCGLLFTCLFLLPALDLAWQRRVNELASHCVFNVGLLGPYLLHAVAPALFRRHRDALLTMGDVFKALLVLLAMLGVMTLPQAWADFAQGHMDVVMLVIIKPLSEQVQVRMALLQRTVAVISDTYIYATVLYGGAILPAAVRAVLQNTAALVLLLLLDTRARLRFLPTVATGPGGGGTTDAAASCKMAAGSSILVNAHDGGTGAGLQHDVGKLQSKKDQ